MRNISKNYLKLTIHQTKIVSSAFFEKTYSLKIKVLEQSLISDKISGKFFDYNKSFFFDIPSQTQQINFEISANIKSFYFFDAEIGNLNFIINLSKILEKSEWYSIKNNQNEIVLMVLLSLSYDGSEVDKEVSPSKKASRNSENLSYDKIKVHMNRSIISNTVDDLNERNGQNNSHIINISNLDINNISHISKINVSTSKKTHFPNAQSGGYSNIPTDLSKISIFSSTNTHHHLNSNPTNELKKTYKNGETSEYVSTLDSILEADEDNSNKKFSYENIGEYKKKFIAKYNKLKEKKEKLNKNIDELRLAKDKLRQKENLIKKERDLYESQIKQLQLEKQQYYQNTQVLQYKMKRLHDNREEYQSIFNYDRDLFLNLNFLLNIPNNLEEKIQDLNHSFTMFSNLKYRRKEGNLREKEGYRNSIELNKEFSITFPTSTKNSNKNNISHVLKENKDLTINNIISSNLNNSIEKDIDNTSLSNRSNSINCVNSNKQKKTDNNNKFHPPTAKIDLAVDDRNKAVENRDSSNKPNTVELKINKERFVSGSAEKMKKNCDKNRIVVPNNSEKKDGLVNQSLLKKKNLNVNLGKSPKFNEVGTNNKQVNGNGNGNGVKGKRSNK